MLLNVTDTKDPSVTSQQSTFSMILIKKKLYIAGQLLVPSTAALNFCYQFSEDDMTGIEEEQHHGVHHEEPLVPPGHSVYLLHLLQWEAQV